MRNSTALLLSGCLWASTAAAVSFDCHKAKTHVEKAVCGDLELGKLDDQLAAAYKAALISHPIPDYVKARQKDWNEGFQATCEGVSGYNACLAKGYRERIGYLKHTPQLTVFSNTRNFSYVNADLVVEYWKEDARWGISVFGGAVIHEEASRENGYATYVPCEFDGTMASPESGHAIGDEGTKIGFHVNGDTFTFDEGTEQSICPGFSRLPDDPLKKISKQ